MKKYLLSSFVILSLIITACGSDDDGYTDSDTEAPSVPFNLTTTIVTETSIHIIWDSSSDNVEVTGYFVYLDGNKIQTINETTTTINDLVSGNYYSINVSAFDANGNESNQSETLLAETIIIEIPLVFEIKLSDMGIYTGDLSNLTPKENVHLYDLNSRLFTDYAHKQRLLRMPEGAVMQYDNSDLLPIFPNNTLISKTFYYYEDESNTASNKIIIETRVLIKTEGTWKVGNYKWNNDMTEATYTNDGSIVSVEYLNTEGITQNIEYQIPSNVDCITCHNIYDVIVPIGPKLRSMNFNPNNGTVNINQLQYFINEGLLEGVSNPSDISILPDWEDDNFDILEQGRAYMDINCAHCHQPGGNTPTGFLLDFRLETAFNDTGIYSRRGQIEDRIQSNTPGYMMPKIGRSIVYTEAVEMLLEYLEVIEE